MICATSHESYVGSSPNGAGVPDPSGGYVRAIGHTSHAGGGKLNVYGHSFQSAGNLWTKDLCISDSDGDGFTNGGELGDPCCVWSIGATPRWRDGLSMPGEPASVPAARAGCTDAVCENGVDPCTGRTPPPSATSSPLPQGVSPSSSSRPRPTRSARAHPDDAPPSMPDVEAGALVAGAGAVALVVGMATQWVRLRRRRPAPPALEVSGAQPLLAAEDAA